MSVMTSFTARTLAKNRVRTAVTIAGVTLAAALLTAVLTSVSSLNGYMYESALATGGSHQADVWTTDEAAVAEARNHENITGLSVVRDAGFVSLDDFSSSMMGLLPLVQIDDSFMELCAPDLMKGGDGRMPESPGEITLPSYWKNDVFAGQEVTLGATLTMPVGWRESVVDRTTPEGASWPERLNSGYGDSNSDDDSRGERLVEVEERTYTVVGFYTAGNFATSTGLGSAALVYGDNATGDMRVYFTTEGFSRHEEIQNLARSIFGTDANANLNSNILRYQGIMDDRAYWDTFTQMAAVLAIVIMIACISLIYNAFSISVAERTRQFGLLASIGASKRQIRRAILFESALVALIGIPLGIVVGVGGTAAVLTLLAPTLEQLLGDIVAFKVVVDPRSLVLAAVLSALTVAASATIPALRASRVSAIDAIRRTQDNREVKTKRTRATSPEKTWKKRGLSDRLFGVGGMIARINTRRGRTKGRAAIVSLALAVVLLMTAGSLSTYLRLSTDVMGHTSDYDVSVYAYYYEDKSLEDMQSDYDALAKTEGATSLGWQTGAAAAAYIPESMAGQAVIAQVKEMTANANGSNAEGSEGTSASDGSEIDTTADESAHRLDDGSLVVNATTVFVDDATFAAYAEKQGLDPADFSDPAHPRAVVAKTVYGNNGQTYMLMETLTGTGTVRLLTNAEYEGTTSDIASYTNEGNAPHLIILPQDSANNDTTDEVAGSDETGDTAESRAEDQDANQASPANSQTSSSSATGGFLAIPATSLAGQAVEVEVAALVDELPSGISTPGSLMFIMPMSQATAFNEDETDAFTSFFATDDHAALAKALEATVQDIMPHAGTSIIDAHANEEQMRLMVFVINVFSGLFTGILALIAVANVFNTITNGLILRRREFAVMKSVGMDDAAFRRMIARECLGYGVKGLVPGIIISVIVSLLLFSALEASISGLTYTLPWAHMLIALAIVAASMLASIAYGLHRCRADNVVEALREDTA